MRNITVTVSDETYRQARVWAAEHDSSLSRIVAYLLQTLPRIKRAVAAFPIKPSPAASSPSSTADATSQKQI
jgi:hypothetical protein